MAGKSGKCGVCGRGIWNPVSVAVGLGWYHRAQIGVCKYGGMNALFSLQWGTGDPEPFYDACESIEKALRALQLVTDCGTRTKKRPDYTESFKIVAELRDEARSKASPMYGLACCWRLVGELRFNLEPGLKYLPARALELSTETLQTAFGCGPVIDPASISPYPPLWVEQVPAVGNIYRDIQRIMCMLGAAADAVDLRHMRREDRKVLSQGGNLYRKAGKEVIEGEKQLTEHAHHLIQNHWKEEVYETV